MASSNPVSPPMSHSAAYYDNRSSVRPLSHNHHYSPTLLHPQAAHLNPNPRSPTTPHRTEPRRVGGSVSSDESGSSTASETERYLHNKQYQYSPQVERGTWKEPVRHSYQPSQIGANLDRGSHTRSELVEDNSTVFRYIQPEASEEAKENDHAFWILTDLAIFPRPFPLHLQRPIFHLRPFHHHLTAPAPTVQARMLTNHHPSPDGRPSVPQPPTDDLCQIA